MNLTGVRIAVVGSLVLWGLVVLAAYLLGVL